MKQTINFSQFCDAFRDYDRNENFSYEGKQLLFDYLEEYGESTGEDVELDVIALCCEYNEDNWEDIANNYDIDLEDCEDEDEKIEAVKTYLEDNTFLIGCVNDEDFIYQAF